MPLQVTEMETCHFEPADESQGAGAAEVDFPSGPGDGSLFPISGGGHES